MKIGKNKDALGSRPVWGVTFRPTCFPIRLLAVPGFRISDRTRLRLFPYSLFTMKKYLLIFAMILISCSMSAQTVYAYLYEYTDNDGVKTKQSSYNLNGVNFVYFNGDMIGVSCVSEDYAYDGWNEYEKKAINDINSNISESKCSPGYPTDTYGFYKYSSDYSTSNAKTYRWYGAKAYFAGFTPYSVSPYRWGSPSWGSILWSISYDKNKLIIWFLDKNERRYYKRITRSDLRPNTDFLNE